MTEEEMTKKFEDATAAYEDRIKAMEDQLEDITTKLEEVIKIKVDGDADIEDGEDDKITEAQNKEMAALRREIRSMSKVMSSLKSLGTTPASRENPAGQDKGKGKTFASEFAKRVEAENGNVFKATKRMLSEENELCQAEAKSRGCSIYNL